MATFLNNVAVALFLASLLQPLLLWVQQGRSLSIAGASMSLLLLLAALMSALLAQAVIRELED